MADLSGENPELVKAVREIHDGVFKQGKTIGVDEFIKYLFENSILLDEYDKAGILYYADQWKELMNAAD